MYGILSLSRHSVMVLLLLGPTRLVIWSLAWLVGISDLGGMIRLHEVLGVIAGIAWLVALGSLVRALGRDRGTASSFPLARTVLVAGTASSAVAMALSREALSAVEHIHVGPFFPGIVVASLIYGILLAIAARLLDRGLDAIRSRPPGARIHPAWASCLALAPFALLGAVARPTAITPIFSLTGSTVERTERGHFPEVPDATGPAFPTPTPGGWLDGPDRSSPWGGEARFEALTLRTARPGYCPVDGLAWGPDERWVAVADDDEIEVLDLDGRCLAAYRFGQDGLPAKGSLGRGLLPDPSGTRLLALSHTGTGFRLLSLATSRTAIEGSRELRLPEPWLDTIGFDSVRLQRVGTGGLLLVTRDWNTRAAIFAPDQADPLVETEGFQGMRELAAWLVGQAGLGRGEGVLLGSGTWLLPDSRRILTTWGHAGLSVREFTGEAVLGSIRPQDLSPHRPEVTGDGRLVSAGDEHTATVHRLDTGAEVVRFRRYQGHHALAPSRDGSMLATGGGDGSVVVWRRVP